ncbi:heavy metal sensor histidine kinase [Burkholderia sp. WSM2230]|uniref:heavy metal sensor histidine kinase n=1 Tax=Burkholderia sp. WSM2230 TaxID=944435 RepID=UPI00040A24E3|nr:heavy metal sensor histidine kinase [Burkholderia sp. WSM2230]
MRGRSLTATLALAFGGTTLAVFALVGSFVYLALDHQIKAQDDLDIVLATRHARRLAEELEALGGIREHGDRLVSTVLGNEAMSMVVTDRQGNVLISHNLANAPTGSAASASSAGSAAAGLSAAGAAPLPRVAPVPAGARITEASIADWRDSAGAPIRGIVAAAQLRNGEIANLLIARNMTDRWLLLDRYRDKLHLAGAAGVVLAFMLGYLLIRAALRPLRDIAASAGSVTVDRLHTRISVAHVPLELETLVASLNAMLQRMEDGFQRQSRFTADLAHDMRTPLGNMRGATEVALARPRSLEEYEALLASNLEECDRLSRMIENVLFLARAEHPQFVKHMRSFDVVQELTHIAEYFEGVADEANVTVKVTGHGMLTADLELFRRAVNNLLVNAIRYTPPRGRITLDAQAGERRMQIVVANEGEPVAPEHLERIFDRFYRVDPSRSTLRPSGATREATGSAGLGLAIVRTIMELHNGTVRAASDASGTRFILSFPGG